MINMTDFQREILKYREKISFHYEKSDIKIQIIEEKNLLIINLDYYYYFDTSLIDISKIRESFLEKNIINNDIFVEESIENYFRFKHNIEFKIYLDELNKNSYLKNLNKEEVQKYIETKVYSKKFREIVFNIGLVEAISYYKILPVKNFIVMGELNEFQKKWWSKLFFNGLGEYRYLNNLLSIDKKDFINIISNQKINEYEDIELNNNYYKNNEESFQYLNIEKQGFLIPLGGGKDSVVTLELLKKFKNENTLFIIDLKGARKKVANIAGYNKKEIVQIIRNFDSRLKLRNKQGFFNGHIPFSSVIAFLSLFSAYILNKKYIPLSNELSANEATVIDLDINHQYSKSIEFETDFRKYIEFLDLDIEYFSILRPLTEVGIARLFVRSEKYFNVFNSCNVGSKNNKWNWCSNCPKCLFTYIILAPFLYKDKLVDIFKVDVFENKNLLEEMFKLIGKKESKPFECVGTIYETKFSLNMLMEKLAINKENNNSNENKIDKNNRNKIKKLPILLEEYKRIYIKELNREKSKLEKKQAKSIEYLDENKNLYLIYNNDNYLPEFLEEIVQDAIKGE